MAFNKMNMPRTPGRPTEGTGFRLVGFPKEFERSFWELFDKRYYIILLSTWILLYGFFFFMATRNWQLSEEEIQRIKQKVITRVYGAEIIAPTEPLEEEETELLMAGEEKPAEEISEEGRKLVEESTTERVERRRASRASRAAQIRKMQQEVASAGILAVATAAGGAGTGSVEYGDVLRDLAGGAGGVADVGEVVAGTVGIAAATTGGERTRVAKGAGYRGAGEGVGIDELIQGEGISRTASFTRRGEIRLASNMEITGAAAGKGSRDQEGIMSGINKNKTSIEYCFQKRLKINPNLRGDIYLEVEISPQGRITFVKILSSTLKDKKLENCITRAIRRWRGFGKIDPSLGSVRTRFKYIF